MDYINYRGEKSLRDITPELAAPPATSARVTFKKVLFLSKPAGEHVKINQQYIGDVKGPIVERSELGRTRGK